MSSIYVQKLRALATAYSIGVFIREMEDAKLNHYAAAQLEVRPFILSASGVAGTYAKAILRDLAIAHLRTHENRIGKTSAFFSRLTCRLSILLIRFASTLSQVHKNKAYHGP